MPRPQTTIKLGFALFALAIFAVSLSAQARLESEKTASCTLDKACEDGLKELAQNKPGPKMLQIAKDVEFVRRRCKAYSDKWFADPQEESEIWDLEYKIGNSDRYDAVSELGESIFDVDNSVHRACRKLLSGGE